MNQDSCFIKKDFANYKNVWLLGICDGHGVFGHLVSSYISKYFPGISYLKKTRKFIET